MFAWDGKKASANVEKHGVAFEEAATIFVDANALDGDDPRHSASEHRRRRIGRSLSGRILFVVYTIRRRSHEKETIRIISARQASRKERQAYAGRAD
ncbi:MAG: BrnT family toxin [Nitrospira sp.]|nr:BrnT family toxin [Nitrospira sp.]MCS6287285.1 BrnT family toxin [Nitrospira sp.]